MKLMTNTRLHGPFSPPNAINLVGVTAVPFSFQHHKEGLIKSVEILKNGGPKNAVEEKFMGGLGGWPQRVVDSGHPAEDIKFVTPEEGVELSYQEILTIYDKCGIISEGKVYRGAPGICPITTAPSKPRRHVLSLTRPVIEKVVQFTYWPWGL